jgi:hypothetical protein
MIVNKRMNVLVLLAGLGMATAALAHDETREWSRPNFEDMDANKDLLISPDEIEAFRESRNGDRAKHPKRSKTSRFLKADTDGDGYVNQAEFDALRDQVRESRRRHRRGPRPHEDADDGS